MPTPRLGLPDLGLGIGLRTTHFPHLRECGSGLGFLELISDNFSETAGRPLEVLDELARRIPLVMHGVALSIGSTAPLDRAYVRGLVRLRDRIGARWVSDHLCFTGLAGRNTHDLLPIPYTEASLAHVAGRVRAVQDLLGAPLVLENPSTYVAFRDSTMPEWEFLTRLCTATGCGLLLDVNNLWVCARNHGFDPQTYLAGVPWDHVVQFHVAGHRDRGTHLVDTHDGPVIDPVWDLLGQAWRRCGGASVLLEWDADIPPYAEVEREVLRARRILPRGAVDAAGRRRDRAQVRPAVDPTQPAKARRLTGLRLPVTASLP